MGEALKLFNDNSAAGTGRATAHDFMFLACSKESIILSLFNKNEFSLVKHSDPTNLFSCHYTKENKYIRIHAIFII